MRPPQQLLPNQAGRQNRHKAGARSGGCGFQNRRHRIPLLRRLRGSCLLLHQRLLLLREPLLKLARARLPVVACPLLAGLARPPEHVLRV